MKLIFPRRHCATEEIEISKIDSKNFNDFIWPLTRCSQTVYN